MEEKVFALGGDRWKFGIIWEHFTSMQVGYLFSLEKLLYCTLRMIIDLRSQLVNVSSNPNPGMDMKPGTHKLLDAARVHWNCTNSQFPTFS